MRITYGGDMYNPLDGADTEDIISVNLIKGVVDSSDFSFDGKNILNLNVK